LSRANVPDPYELPFSDESSGFMKLAFGEFDGKLRKLGGRAFARLPSHLNRKMRLLILLKEDIVMETVSLREIFLILSNFKIGRAHV
jgi:hypothetical protein